MREYINYYDYDDERQVRYRKKRIVTKPKTSKAKHKHEYKPCNFKVLEFDNAYQGAYCIICGKIQNIKRANDVDATNPTFTINYLDKYVKEFENG